MTNPGRPGAETDPAGRGADIAPTRPGPHIAPTRHGAMPRATRPAALGRASYDDVPVLPYARWTHRRPGTTIRGGPVLPPDAPAWTGLALTGGVSWLRGPDSLPEGIDLVSLAGRYALVGPAIRHFGHMVGEFMHRLWVLKDDPGLVPVLLATPGPAEIPRFVRDYLGMIGAADPVLLRAPARLGTLVIGEPGRLLEARCTAAYGRMLGAMLRPGLLDLPGEAPRLAIMRGHLATGRCTGEAWIEAVLADQGYRIFRPEAHSLAEQFAAVSSAERIVMTEGSALHIFDLLPPVRARIAVLGRRPGMGIVRRALAEKTAGLVAYPPDFMVGTLDASQPRANALSRVDPMDVLRLLAEHGFIDRLPDQGFLDTPGLLEADVAAYAAHFRPRHDAATIDAFIAAAIAACRAGVPDPALQEGLALGR